MSYHAKLSASGSKQWINCPGSVAAEALNPRPRGSSIFAQEGTAAHLLCELYANDGIHPEEFLGDTIYIWNDDAVLEKDFSALRERVRRGEITSRRPMDPDAEIEAEFLVDQDMVDAVGYFVMAVEASRARLDPRGREERSEQWLSKLEELHPLLGGTADYIGVEAFGWAELVDYKHGRGILVEVCDNTQLKTYGLGVLLEFPDCEGVRMTIVQPRKEHEDGPIRSIEYTREELLAFGEELKAAAEATQKINAERAAGDWCTFCAAKAFTDEDGVFQECPALVETMQESAKFDFADEPPEVGLDIPASANELAERAKWLGIFDKYVKAVEAAIQQELLAGRPVEGKKLVRKRANRAFGVYTEDIDELTGTEDSYWERLSAGDVEAIMESELGLASDQCYQPGKLKSPAQFEKMGKEVKKLVGEMAYKPEGGLTVADENDPRPAVEVASGGATDFPDDLGT
jgi:hypothetical protein